ncbi:hypothetical protein D3C71_1086820 [compost metagenome]
MIIVNYTSEGKAVSDFSSMEFAKSLKDNPNKTVDISTETTILAVRVLIKQGFYSTDEIKIVRDGVDCEANSSGKINPGLWASTAWDDYLDILIDLK